MTDVNITARNVSGDTVVYEDDRRGVMAGVPYHGRHCMDREWSSRPAPGGLPFRPVRRRFAPHQLRHAHAVEMPRRLRLGLCALQSRWVKSSSRSSMPFIAARCARGGQHGRSTACASGPLVRCFFTTRCGGVSELAS
jgi:hypothetical protein